MCQETFLFYIQNTIKTWQCLSRKTIKRMWLVIFVTDVSVRPKFGYFSFSLKKIKLNFSLFGCEVGFFLDPGFKYGHGRR